MKFYIDLNRSSFEFINLKWFPSRPMTPTKKLHTLATWILQWLMALVSNKVTDSADFRQSFLDAPMEIIRLSRILKELDKEDTLLPRPPLAIVPCREIVDDLKESVTDPSPVRHEPAEDLKSDDASFVEAVDKRSDRLKKSFLPPYDNSVTLLGNWLRFKDHAS